MKTYSLIALLVALEVGVGCAEGFPQAIPVVKTWEQLRDAPVVAKGDFGTVRVGLEQLEAPRLSGVVVYALVQRGANNQVKTRFTRENVLGPLVCRITRKHAPVAAESKLLAEIGFDHADARELLYTRAVYIDVVGVRLSARPRGSALPVHEGMVPVAWIGEKQQPLRGESLPTLLPQKASTTLSLQGDAKELLIESETEMIVARPDWHYLARWWVNDKPFIPKPAEQLPEQNGMITSGRRVRVSLDFVPDDFGAKSGDKIGLQLLHLPGGWRQVDSYGVEQLAAANEGPTVSRMTNRIEFTAP